MHNQSDFVLYFKSISARVTLGAGDVWLQWKIVRCRFFTER
jgi:hypothetical protein